MAVGTRARAYAPEERVLDQLRADEERLHNAARIGQANPESSVVTREAFDHRMPFIVCSRKNRTPL
jgi:hypothetical protein